MKLSSFVSMNVIIIGASIMPFLQPAPAAALGSCDLIVGGHVRSKSLVRATGLLLDVDDDYVPIAEVIPAGGNGVAMSEVYLADSDASGAVEDSCGFCDGQGSADGLTVLGLAVEANETRVSCDIELIFKQQATAKTTGTPPPPPPPPAPPPSCQADITASAEHSAQVIVNAPFTITRASTGTVVTSSMSVAFCVLLPDLSNWNDGSWKIVHDANGNCTQDPGETEIVGASLAASTTHPVDSSAHQPFNLAPGQYLFIVIYNSGGDPAAADAQCSESPESDGSQFNCGDAMNVQIDISAN